MKDWHWSGIVDRGKTRARKPKRRTFNQFEQLEILARFSLPFTRQACTRDIFFFFFYNEKVKDRKCPRGCASSDTLIRGERNRGGEIARRGMIYRSADFSHPTFLTRAKGRGAPAPPPSPLPRRLPYYYHRRFPLGPPGIAMPSAAPFVSPTRYRVFFQLCSARGNDLVGAYRGPRGAPRKGSKKNAGQMGAEAKGEGETSGGQRLQRNKPSIMSSTSEFPRCGERGSR